MSDGVKTVKNGAILEVTLDRPTPSISPPAAD
jgi:hypothetical protein